VLAGVFAVAAVTKLADLPGSRAAAAEFGVPPRFAPAVGTLLPFAELAVAAALIPAGSARIGAIGALVLLVAFVLAIAHSIRRGEAPDCHCFGQLSSAPVGWRTLVRNGVLVGLAAFVVAAGWGNAGPSASAWIGQLSATGVVALAAGLAIAALAALTAWALLALLRQQGRLLLRIDELEARLAASGAPPLAEPHHGLPIGEPAPTFSLPGLYGESVTIESLTAADAPVLLLFTDPRCAPCNALLPQISGWQREHAGRLTIAILTRGDVTENRAKMREHGIVSVWIDTQLDVYDAYQANGTPGAVLIDPQRRIASGVVGGAEAIADLVDAATNAPPLPVVQVPAGREAPPMPVVPPVGADAPTLDLRDAAGARLELAVPEGDTLVLFWNPGCGFCQRMVEDLRSFEQSPPPGAPRLLFISSGSAADHEEQGLTAPCAIDAAFTAGSAFGSTGTPSAILVDRHGRVASGLAVGAPQVMALATAGVRSEA
jgi:methylamine dehydrogenase accessory protein MauD